MEWWAGRLIGGIGVLERGMERRAWCVSETTEADGVWWMEMGWKGSRLKTTRGGSGGRVRKRERVFDDVPRWAA